MRREQDSNLRTDFVGYTLSRHKERAWDFFGCQIVKSILKSCVYEMFTNRVILTLVQFW